MSSHHQQIKPVSVFRSHHNCQKKLKEPHLAKIATHNWRQNATSKAKTSQRAQKQQRLASRPSESRNAWSSLSPECIGPVNVTRCCAMCARFQLASAQHHQVLETNRLMHMLPDQAVLPVRSRRVYTIRARNRCKCEAPGNKATGDSKHHLPPSITPTVMCQDVCDPPVQNLTAPCTCARVSELFVFNKRGTQKKKNDEMRHAFSS